MDFGKIKDLVKKLGGVVITDGDNPEFVVLDYNKFQELDRASNVRNFYHDNYTGSVGNAVGGLDTDGLDTSQSEIERLNREILSLKENIRQKESAELAYESDLVSNDNGDADVMESEGFVPFVSE